jgi:hypothetical protein
MLGRWLTLACIAAPVLASAQVVETGGGKVDQGTHNVQTVHQPAGDRSVVRQTAGPGSEANVQSVTIAAPGEPPGLAVQTTSGAGNTQSIVMSGGGGNVVVQTQGGHRNHQSVVQTGSGNVAVQVQRGDGLGAALRQHGGQTDLQVQQPGRTP